MFCFLSTESIHNPLCPTCSSMDDQAVILFFSLKVYYTAQWDVITDACIKQVILYFLYEQMQAFQ